mmetsp:Transcript_11109/g.24879  ORF Transcript_11109/g.24879 Transcript_11109/m.24879 type:complete len:524 (+) Transcript_11109:50-1621(+)
MASFPIGSRVILQDLKKEVFNGKVGVVRSSPKDDRQQVFVDGNTYNLKLSNLRFDVKSSSSLSVKDMKAVLKVGGEMTEKEITGLSKKELISLVEAKCPDEQERMRIIAQANAPPPASGASAGGAVGGGMNANTVRSQADMMANMDPAQLRQQAQMLRTMSADQIRQMNPMMKNFSDAQIRMAASQMEMMASNPAMMKTAAEQMKNMNQSDLDELQRNGLGASAGAAAPGGAAAAPAFPSSQYGTVPTPGAPGGAITPEQMQQAQHQMNNMSPEQLRQQAAMLKSMTPAQIRQMNPSMAGLSDDQIQQSAAQLEMLASNPEMMEMARQQAASMSAEDMKALQECQSSLFGGGGGGDGGSAMPTDPSQIDPSKMDPAVVKKMMKVLKKNPSMLKQMMASQPGMAAGSMDGISEEQVSAMIDKFDGMSEDQIEMVMGVMGKAQKVLGPVMAGYRKANSAVGGQLGKIILFIIAFLIIRSIMSWMGSSVPVNDSDGEAIGAMLKETVQSSSTAGEGGEQEEFAEEF